ncbi:MAG: hypothetical protein KDD70_14315 [Bdellovibrionales bacterium]|nr:hypothetical protein [Bdellovibrionales bacterium]
MSTGEPTEIYYQLVFQGPVDDSTDTLRKLRGALIGDLQLHAEKAKFLLENAPITIRESADQTQLIPQLKKLEGAGARALIIRSQKLNQVNETEDSLNLQMTPTAQPTATKREARTSRKDLTIASRRSNSKSEELPLSLNFDDFLEPAPHGKHQKESEAAIRKEIEQRFEEAPEYEDLLLHLKKNALIDDDQLPTTTPLSTLKPEPTCARVSPLAKKRTYWKTYREWISLQDVSFRKMLNEEMIIGTIVSCVLTIIVCALLIPLELQMRSSQWNRERKVDNFLDSYADFVAYGNLPLRGGKK